MAPSVDVRTPHDAISHLVRSSNPNSLLADYVSEPEFVRDFAITIRTARRWTRERTGPAVTKIGNRLYYSRSAIARWLQSREQKPCRTRMSRRNNNAA
jgi:hypothetical protein